MAEKKLNFANGGVKYDGHVSSTTAADSFATAYSLNVSNFTPFPMPYYNPGIFFNQNYQPALQMQNFAGYPFWHPFATASTDYVFNLQALQNMQAMAAAANHCGESFYDVLNRISQTPSCVGDEKDFVPNFCVNPSSQMSCSPVQTPLCQTSEITSIRTSSSRTYVSTPFANQVSSSSSPSSTSSPHSNLATLAEVASCLTQEVFSKTSTCDTKSPSTTTSAEVEVNKNGKKNSRKRVSKTNNECERKVPKIEAVDERKEVNFAAINGSVDMNQFVNNNDVQESFKQWNETNHNIATLNANNYQLDPNLLNASAIAWAALTEQLLAAAERQDILNKRSSAEKSEEDARKIVNQVEDTPKSIGKTVVTKPKRPYRRRNALAQHLSTSDNCSSLENDGRDHVDETINEIMNLVSSSAEVCPKIRRPRKIALKFNNAAGVSNTSHAQTDDICTNEALDLTIKKHKLSDLEATDFELLPNWQRISALPHQKIEESVHYGMKKAKECKIGSKKRRIAETESVRVPLNKGWRRQTCIRTISASGLRGDVIYYAPCGRRLASCGEVLRYLKKIPDNELNREHFSFSSKVLVGEFLEIKPTGNKNLTEDEIREIVQSLQRPKVSTGVLAGSKNCLLNKPADVALSLGQSFMETFSETIPSHSDINEKFADSLPSSSNFETLDEIEKAVRVCMNDLVYNVSESIKLEHFDKQIDGWDIFNDFHHLYNSPGENIQTISSSNKLNSTIDCHETERLEQNFVASGANDNEMTNFNGEKSSKFVETTTNSPSDAVTLLKMNEI